MSQTAEGITSLIIVGVLFFMYFLPFLVAWKRKHRNKSAIGVLNLLLGWTMIGWIGSMVWAFTSNTYPNAEQR